MQPKNQNNELCVNFKINFVCIERICTFARIFRSYMPFERTV